MTLESLGDYLKGKPKSILTCVHLGNQLSFSPKCYTKNAFFYDENRNLVKRLDFHVPSKLIDTYTYITKANYENTIRYEFLGNQIVHYNIYQFDKFRNLVEDEEISKRGYSLTKTYYTYDANNNLIFKKKIDCMSNLIIYSCSIKYTSDSSRIETAEIKYMNSVEKTWLGTFEYEDNIIISEKYLFNNKRYYEYQVKQLDKKGNWIKREFNSNFYKNHIYQREIEYHI
ncbi:hypothetical protein [Sediminibacterium sp.]|uniref:hypothetical protein n=1 Tax=Sediminibacterium sp. TaxID=1917865 RepID=UPI0027346250|nr:hypothetical protein [Sediminibacterium sp.]MDP3395005.1 hypothetical protein [Sediminibacterium sp.]MDP3565631.1 hypothetical protein [Sediminibacterium sp.]